MPTPTYLKIAIGGIVLAGCALVASAVVHTAVLAVIGAGCVLVVVGATGLWRLSRS